MANAPPAVPNRNTPFFIVMNARSGTGDATDVRQKMQSVLTQASQAHEFVLVERPEDIARQAQRAVELARKRQGAVIATGGDGTINAVAHAALPWQLPFGIVPQGTFNYSSRTHAISLDPEEATRALLDARLKPIQVGVVNERIFLVNASLGLYPKLFERREEAKEQFGRYRAIALLAGLRGLCEEHRQLVLDIEHDAQRETVRTPTLFVGNNSLQLERIGLPEADDVQQWRLAAVIVRTNKARALLWLALRGALGQLADAKNVRDFSFRKMTVNPWLRYRHRDIKIALDGEVLRMRPPLKFSIAEQPLWLLAPAGNEVPTR